MFNMNLDDRDESTVEELRKALRSDASYTKPAKSQSHVVQGSRHPGNNQKPAHRPTYPPINQNQGRHHNPQAQNRRWSALIRIVAFFGSLLGMYISAQFSVDGFNFSIDDRKWIGWALAIILIMLQSVWQKFGDNLTLFAIALVCYAYGIFTNVAGIIANRDASIETWIIAIIFGILLEVFPEPVLAWAISGDTSSDPLRKMIGHIENDVQLLNKFNFKI